MQKAAALLPSMTLRDYAQLQVPRYTSYPTAAEFTTRITAAHHRSWLESLNTTQPVSLYMHVPYCRDICSYCGCNTKKAVREDVVAAYRHALETEIGLVGATVGRPLKVARLHWGGGTPTILGEAGLWSVLDTLRRHVVFEDTAEHAIELDPRYVTPDLARALSGLGVNRASLGVQDVNPAVQAAIGRLQPIADVTRAVDALRAAGIANINFDLIYGLPRQTIASLTQTCDAVVDFAPDRVACYGYAHLPSLRANQKLIDEKALPGVDERLEQAELIANRFEQAGYVRVGLDHFAKPTDALATAVRTGHLQRNFQGYTDDAEPTLIGLGASSISTFAQGFVQNVSDVPSYVKAINAGKFATARGCPLSEDDQLRGRIVERLMCDFAVDLDAVAPAFDCTEAFDRLVPMVADGLVTLEGRRITMTPEGRTLVRVVASVFDAYRDSAIKRFSVAV
jgi:oxygen-independent coproporphyrinogen-3 oxidase